jgi:hypothetical protein
VSSFFQVVDASIGVAEKPWEDRIGRANIQKVQVDFIQTYRPLGALALGQYGDSSAGARCTIAKWEPAPIPAAVPSTYPRYMMDLRLFHAPRIASVLAIGSFSLVVALADFARRRRISFAFASGVEWICRSIASSPQEPSNPYVLAQQQPSPATEWQSPVQVESVAGLPGTDRRATAPSLRLGELLPLPLPSARDQVVRLGTSRIGTR